MTLMSMGIDFCETTAVATGTGAPAPPPPRPPAGGGVDCTASPPVQAAARTASAAAIALFVIRLRVRIVRGAALSGPRSAGLNAPRDKIIRISTHRSGPAPRLFAPGRT